MDVVKQTVQAAGDVAITPFAEGAKGFLGGAKWGSLLGSGLGAWGGMALAAWLAAPIAIGVCIAVACVIAGAVAGAAGLGSAAGAWGTFTGLFKGIHNAAVGHDNGVTVQNQAYIDDLTRQRDALAAASESSGLPSKEGVQQQLKDMRRTNIAEMINNTAPIAGNQEPGFTAKLTQNQTNAVTVGAGR